MPEHQATLSHLLPAEMFVLSSPPARPCWRPEALPSRAPGTKAASGHARSNVTALHTAYTSFFLLLFPQMIGKTTAGVSETSPASIPRDDLSWQLLRASLAASGAASPFSRARRLQDTRQSKRSAFLQRSFREGSVKPPLFQQPPLQGTRNSCIEEDSADFFS